MGNPVTWFDLGATDPAPLRTFYAELFGWTLQPISEFYTVIATGGGVGGGIGRSQTGDSWSTFYVEVGDLRATLDKVGSIGGSTVVPPIEIPGVAVWAMFHDPDGLLVGLVDRPMGDGGDGPVGQGAPVDWFEVLGSDAKRSQAFYGQLFGWTFDETDANYALVNTGAGRGVSGGVGASGEGVGWATIYANVDDVAKSLSKAEELGGTREYGPIDVDDHMQSGAIRDPVGNLFGVYHHEPH
jgi:predicted enzyme related to lactoylglutathione lyase